MELFFQFFVDSLEPRGHFSRMSERLSSTFTFAPAAQFAHVQTLNEFKNILPRLPIVPQGTVEAIVTDYPFVFADPTWKDDPDLANKVTVPDAYLNRFLVLDEPLDRIPPGNKDDPYNILDSQVYRIQLWKNLKVNRLFDSTTLRIIQSIASMQNSGAYSLEFAQELKRYVEFLSSLNSIAVTVHDSAFSIADAAKQINRPAYLNSCDFVSDAVLQSGPYSKEYHAARIVSQSFLWTAWQRATMLLFYLTLVAILNGEKPDQWLDLLSVAGFDLMENIVSEIEDAVADTAELGYLCNWTFELLRTNRAALTLDFRTLFHRLIAKFGNREPRCVNTPSGFVTCDGRDSNRCQRFANSERKDQSMHALWCNRRTCSLVKWDRESYIHTPSPRAVEISIYDGYTSIQYTKAGENTMAISHVWSHGQGGRPETGVNSCMLRKYSAIAREHGCGSFWIDSACIPDEVELRKEAIRNINNIFQRAKITLVCDRDVIECTVHGENTEDLETLLSSWLVSDWSVRAWTLLEGVRGSQNLYLLCGEDRIIPAVEVVRSVSAKGAIDLAVLSLAASPFIASRASETPSFELAGSFLAHRHATRETDMVIIWSLLCGAEVFTRMEPFLLQVKEIRTAFLMSSAPRLTSPGFRWAPASPNLRNSFEGDSGGSPWRGYHSYDGGGSVSGMITECGFVAKWLVWQPTLETCPRWLIIGWHDTTKYLFPLLESGKDILVIRPLALDGTAYRGSAGRGDNATTTAPLVALCVKDEANDFWIWEGVYIWKGFEVELLRSIVHFEIRELTLV